MEERSANQAARKGDLSYCKNGRGIMLLRGIGGLSSWPKLYGSKSNTADFCEAEPQVAVLLGYELYRFRKTLDSISRDVLPRLSRHYVMPDKVVTILRGLYESFSSQVVHTGQRTQPLNMKTGVREVCRQSALQTSQKENNNRIPFTLIFHPHNHAVKSVPSF